MIIKRYIKRPIVIEAVQLSKENMPEVLKWCKCPEWKGEIFMMTLAGMMTARNGDYVIKGANGEFYPCRPDTFEKTYVDVETCEYRTDKWKDISMFKAHCGTTYDAHMVALTVWNFCPNCGKRINYVDINVTEKETNDEKIT